MRGLTHFNPLYVALRTKKSSPMKIVWEMNQMRYLFRFQFYFPDVTQYTSFERLSEENKSQDSHELCGTKSFYIRQHFSNKKYKNVNDIVTVSSRCTQTCRRCFMLFQGTHKLYAPGCLSTSCLNQQWLYYWRQLDQAPWPYKTLFTGLLAVL